MFLLINDAITLVKRMFWLCFEAKTRPQLTLNIIDTLIWPTNFLQTFMMRKSISVERIFLLLSPGEPGSELTFAIVHNYDARKVKSASFTYNSMLTLSQSTQIPHFFPDEGLNQLSTEFSMNSRRLIIRCLFPTNKPSTSPWLAPSFTFSWLGLRTSRLVKSLKNHRRGK